MNKKFSITGMTCAVCSSGIERTVKKLVGVSSASVSLMGESMDVEFDENKLTVGEIAAAVIALGYGCYDFGKVPEKKKKRLTLFVRFIISLILLVPEMYLAMGHMVGLPVPHGWLNYGLQIGLTLATLTVNYAFFVSGVKAAVKLVPNMDTLVTLGAAASFLYSLVVCIVGTDGHLFFESAAMIVTLVTLGKFLEDKSKRKTGREVEKLLSLAPDTVTVERDGAEKKIPVSDLAKGDILIVKQGESLAADGIVVEGTAFADESAVTGESLPVELAVGSRAVSSSILRSGYIKVRAEKVGEETLLAGIVRMVREAGASKAPIQKLADRVSAVFVPVVVGLALITFLIWLAVTHSVSEAFNYGVSVLVISCPCALGLATPVAIMAAAGRGASLGILFKNAEALQRSASIKTVLLDKTATLTAGKPQVVFYEDGGEDEKPIAYAIESKLNHPLASCMTEFCGSGKEAENVEYLTGRGARGTVEGKEYFLGNDRLMREIGADFSKWEEKFEKLSSEGKTVLFLADQSKALAIFALADTLKEGSKEAVNSLNHLGCELYMLTGDNRACAEYIASAAGIRSDRVYAEVLPEDKLAAVKEHMQKNASQKGGRSGVAMIGDGINDSPALKESDVGFAMGNGTDIAIESADAVLVSGDLRAAPKAISLARKTMRIIKQNLFWAFFYNCAGIPLAAGCFAALGVSLNPMIAAAAMSCSSLFVVGNALRLTAYERRKNKKGEDTGMEKKLKVEGMMCAHCVAHVKEALEGVDGVTEAKVDLKKKSATVTLSREVEDSALIAAVERAGYQAKIT